MDSGHCLLRLHRRWTDESLNNSCRQSSPSSSSWSSHGLSGVDMTLHVVTVVTVNTCTPTIISPNASCAGEWPAQFQCNRNLLRFECSRTNTDHHHLQTSPQSPTLHRQLVAPFPMPWRRTSPVQGKLSGTSDSWAGRPVERAFRRVKLNKNLKKICQAQW